MCVPEQKKLGRVGGGCSSLYGRACGCVCNRASLRAQLSSPRSRNFCPQVICFPPPVHQSTDLTHKKSCAEVPARLPKARSALSPCQPRFSGFLLKIAAPERGRRKRSEAPDVEQHWACSESQECHLDGRADVGLSARFHQASALVLQSAFPELCFPNVCRPQGGCEMPEQAGWRLVEPL